MENHHLQEVNQLFLWAMFNSKLLNYQRVKHRILWFSHQESWLKHQYLGFDGNRIWDFNEEMISVKIVGYCSVSTNHTHIILYIMRLLSGKKNIRMVLSSETAKKKSQNHGSIPNKINRWSWKRVCVLLENSSIFGWFPWFPGYG